MTYWVMKRKEGQREFKSEVLFIFICIEIVYSHVFTDEREDKKMNLMSITVL